MKLSGQVALVTGAGRGLGSAVSKVLSDEGATVVAADIDGSSAETTAEELHGLGREARAVQLDVSDSGQVEETISALARELGRVDVLVNNAGVDVTAAVDELTADDFDRILGVNLRGPFACARAVLPMMRQAGRGHIVNIVSTAAKRAWANASGYHASKWGLLGLSHALHVECRPHGVKVTAVVAGGMATPFLLERFPDIDVGTLQDPRNVAEAVRFVLSQPEATVIPEIMVLPMRETSWP